MSALDPNLYTIAWIAPLEIEAQVALHMLDNRHPGRFPLGRGDDYVFQAGDMCGHNVIVATLPAGQEYGTGSAAALASQVKRFFPNLWFGLLVGVAAGLPNLSQHPPRDIRLGDVLVGLPTGDSAGLIAYDLGKETGRDGFQLLRSGRVLANTETVVRSAIGSIKLKAPYDAEVFLAHYENVKNKNHSTGTFTDPGQEHDQLFHLDNEGNDRLVERERRPESYRTRVWYGSIGSGEKLMKDSRKRNSLRDRYNLIGLEMEAAGTMNQIPVGVIRGVCDYGDEHKNKDWQPYAAAMAAAYAKAVLFEIGSKAPAQASSLQHVFTNEENRRLTDSQRANPSERYIGQITRISLNDPFCSTTDNAGLQNWRDSPRRQPLHIKESPGKEMAMSMSGSQGAHQIPKTSTASNTDSVRSFKQIPIHMSKHFQGRESYLTKIHNAFEKSESSPTVISLFGLPGIGKTQLARQYCHRYLDHYSVILWFQADTNAKIREAFSTCAVNLSLEGSDARGDSMANCRILMHWLQSTELTWLLVYDNLDDPQLLQDFWPEGRRGHIIVTSRNPYTAKFRTSAQIHVKPLDKTDSLLLFSKIVGPEKLARHDRRHDHGLERLMEEWKGVPLAINHIGSFINMLEFEIHRFIKLYSENAARILQKRVYEEYPHSIATAFAIQQLDSNATAILHALCYFDPDNIPNELIELSFDGGTGFNSIVYEMDYLDGLENLLKRSLLLKAEDNVSIHRLVQHLVFVGMSDSERRGSFEAVLELLANNYPREKDGQPMWKDWEKCERYLPHVLFLCQRFREGFSGEKSLNLAALLSATTWYMFERGLHTDAETLLQLAQMTCPENSTDLVAATIFFNLAGIRNENNRIAEARELCVRSMEIRETILDPNDPLLANTYYSMGIVYMEDGQLDRSLEYNLKSVKVRKNCKDRDPSPTAYAYGNLGLCYRRRGELENASKYMEKSEALWRKTCGTGSDKYAQITYYLGNLRLDQGRVAEAQELHTVSFKVFSRITPDHFKTGLCHHKMATFYILDRDFHAASNSLRRAIQIFERCFDPMPRLARSMYLLSEVLSQMGLVEEASAIRANAEESRRAIKTLPYDPVSSPEAFDNLVPYFLR